jgi:hypothetical protein
MNTLLVVVGGALIGITLLVLSRALVFKYWGVEEILATLRSIDDKLGMLSIDDSVRDKHQRSLLESIDKKLGKLSDEKNSQP